MLRGVWHPSTHLYLLTYSHTSLSLTYGRAVELSRRDFQGRDVVELEQLWGDHLVSQARYLVITPSCGATTSSRRHVT